MSHEHATLLESVEDKSQAQFRKKSDISTEKENSQNNSVAFGKPFHFGRIN